MNKILIQNPRIINEGRSFIGSVLVANSPSKQKQGSNRQPH